MNDSEIIKALECCTSTKGGCKECPLKGYDKVDCQLITATEAYKLINRQQAEIDRLNIELKTMRGAANSWKAEAEKLKNSPIIGTLCPMWKSQAVREFAEKLKKKTYPFPCAIGVENAVTLRAINELVEEMVGYDNAD